VRRNAVLVTVLFAFLVTFTSISYSFWEFYQLNRSQYINHIFIKYEVITRILREHYQSRNSDAMLEANFAAYNLELVDNALKGGILQHSKVLKQEKFKAVNEAFVFNPSGVIRQQMVEDMRATMLQGDNTIYFYIESPHRMYLLQDTSLKPYHAWNLIYAFIMIVSILVIAFVLILQRIRPLRLLRKRIASFGAGNMDVSFAIKGRMDEIAIVANELDDARQKIRSLLESRTLFLRNIMHELKTPIAKGRIASQMLDSDKNRLRFNKIFERMEVLINEFALIEEVTSGSEHLKKEEYRLIDLIDGAVDLAMMEPEQVEIDVPSQVKIQADYKLFATAIKNMIDNAVKYSPDKQVKVGFSDGEIWFENRGSKLSHPLAYYVEPFTKEHPSKNSFGLGLYLVDSILKHHDMVLAYEFEEGINRFIFVKTIAKPK
jgi:two-component system OmpR family sensor kinase